LSHPLAAGADPSAQEELDKLIAQQIVLNLLRYNQRLRG
jgi:hypothetical protein